jgi:hypothetical protein
MCKIEGKLHTVTVSPLEKETYWEGHWIGPTARLDMVARRKNPTSAMN